jgi:hypothetical protein
MEKEDTAQCAASHRADSNHLEEWCVKMLNALTAALSNAIGLYGFFFKKTRTSLMASPRKYST